MSTALKTDGQTLKFVAVEMLHKSADINTKPDMGLFRGLRMRAVKKEGAGISDKLLNLVLVGTIGKKNELTGFSLEHYKVLSIRLKYGTTKEFMIFKAHEEDQKLAIELLVAILDTLRSEKKMLDNDAEIIDVDKYTDLPYDLEKGTQTNVATTSTGGGYHRNVASTTTDWEAKRKAEDEEKKRQEELRYTPFIIKRATQLPTAAMLMAIKKKVSDLASGDYAPPEVPEIVEKTPKEGTAAQDPAPPPARVAGYIGE